MFTIGVFARLGDISVRMLRHYDEIGLLTPAQVDPVTGYRSYSIAQLGELNRIVALRGLGFSLAEVRHLLTGITVPELQAMLLVRQAGLEQQIEVSRSALSRVEARLRAIEAYDVLSAIEIQAPLRRPEDPVPAVTPRRLRVDPATVAG